MIGGNTIALIQVNIPVQKNSIGEKELCWFDVVHLKGWLDYQSGDSKRNVYSTKLEESTHIFLCDFTSFKCLSAQWEWNPFNFLKSIINLELEQDVDVTSENARMKINGKLYDILLIDDPMNLHQHLEIYLKYTGGQ